jgi:hypothetical protein
MRQILCKGCRLEKKYYAKDFCQPCYKKSIEKEYRNRYFSKEENRIKRRLKQQRFKENNPDYFKKYNKEWEEENREERKIYKKEYDKLYYQNNKDIIKNNVKDWGRKNKEKIRRYKQKHYEKNKDKILIHKKIYKKINNDKIYAQIKNRIENDINFKIKRWLSCRINIAVKMQSSNKAVKTIELLGCSIQEFRQYIERQFRDGMSWDNYGIYWHLDHIIPCAHFLLVEKEQQKLCFHYTNYQPMEKIENIRKGAKILEEELLVI